MKAQGKNPTAPNGGKFLPAESKGHLLYGVPVMSVMDLFEAVWAKVPVTVGARIKGESIDQIYVGTAQVSEADAQQAHECMWQLVDEMKKAVDSTGAHPGSRHPDD